MDLRNYINFDKSMWMISGITQTNDDRNVSCFPIMKNRFSMTLWIFTLVLFQLWYFTIVNGTCGHISSRSALFIFASCHIVMHSRYLHPHCNIISWLLHGFRAIYSTLVSLTDISLLCMHIYQLFMHYLSSISFSMCVFDLNFLS